MDMRCFASKESRDLVGKQTLHLVVPAPEDGEDPRTLLDTEVLRERVEHLALAVPKLAAEQMLEGLYRLNRHPVDSSHHEELADLYWQAFQQLRHHCCNTPAGSFQLSAKALQFQKIMRQLAIELGYAYKYVITRRWRNKSVLGRGQIGQSALLRALESLSFQLLFLYDQHEKDVLQVWREVFQIYQLAESEGVQDKYARASGSETPDVKISISMRFAQILLIRLLDPWRLAMGELWAAHRFLDVGAGFSRITPCEKAVAVGASFVFSLSAVQLPSAVRHGRSIPASPDCRVLHTLQLNRYISRELARLSAQTQGLKGDASQRLLKLMLLAWNEPPARKASRKPARGWLQVAWGLDAVAHFYTEDHAGVELELQPIVEMTDAIGLGRQAPRTFSLERWRQVDNSVSGMCLEFSTNTESRPRPGDLVLLRHGDGQHHLGYICWLQQHGERMARVGISLLNGRFRAVKVKPIVVGKTISGQLPALLAESNKKDAGLGLLIERGAYHEAAEFLVEDRDRMYRLDRRQLLDRTASFDYLDVVLM